MAIYASEDLKTMQILNHIDTKLELVVVKCKSLKSSFIVASTYRPPKYPVTEYMDTLLNFVTSLGKEINSLLLMGDTNICALSDEYKPMHKACEKLDLVQLIKSPTHNNRLIDQIYAHKSLTVHSSGISAPIEKLHAQTSAQIQLLTPERANKQVTVWQYSKTDWERVNKILIDSNILENVKNAPTVQQAATLWQTVIQKIIKEHVPRKTIIPKSKTEWMTPELGSIHKEKKKAYKNWKKSNSQDSKSRYKNCCKKLKK